MGTCGALETVRSLLNALGDHEPGFLSFHQPKELDEMTSKGLSSLQSSIATVDSLGRQGWLCFSWCELWCVMYLHSCVRACTHV